MARNTTDVKHQIDSMASTLSGRDIDEWPIWVARLLKNLDDHQRETYPSALVARMFAEALEQIQEIIDARLTTGEWREPEARQ
jgi:hypothetical protein